MIFALGHEVAAGQGDDDGDEGRLEGGEQGPQGYQEQAGVAQVLVRRQGKFTHHPAVEPLFEEAVDDHYQKGDKEEDGKPHRHGHGVEGTVVAP